MSAPKTPSRCSRRGFTFVELLVVVSVIALLIGILAVALAGVQRAARQSLSERQVNAIATAVETFKTDLGYEPPLLIKDEEADPLQNGAQPYLTPRGWRIGTGTASNPENTLEDYRAFLAEARYHSTVSITAYLVGVGDINGDEELVYDEDDGDDVVEPNYDDGADGPGIRNPGPDRSWGGAADRRAQRPADEVPGGVLPARPPTGRVYGPYLDIGSLGSDVLVQMDDGMYEILDAQGNAIRYYRDWPVRPGDEDDRRVRDIRAVPFELRSPDSARAQFDGKLEDATDLDRSLLTASYAVLAANDDPVLGKVDEGGDIVTREIGPFGDRYVDPASGDAIPVQEEWGDLIEFDPGDSGNTARFSALLDLLQTNARGGV